MEVLTVGNSEKKEEIICVSLEYGRNVSESKTPPRGLPYRFDVEPKDLFHESGKFNKKHIPSPVVTHVGHHYSVEWHGREYTSPGN